jgi:CheY-like chemotaxis protein/anti-sigma regulatory factor (Ser/Thr protein kinase)
MAARLLVVDDEEVNREIIREYLEAEGCELVEAEDGERALTLLGAPGVFDAVLLDRMMPGIDGLEVLRRMKRDPRLAELPVIVQTAAAAHDQVAEGLRLGAYYYLTKPYHRDALVAVVRAALALTRQREELKRQLREYHGVMHLVEQCSYRLRTLEEARSLAAAIGAACAAPEQASMGLAELLVNAIEHGNLGISFEEKAELLSNGGWRKEVERRLALPDHAHKWVEVVFRRAGPELVVRVRDQGKGFDPQRFLTLDESRAFYPNGRGIALARQVAFARIEYLGCGNEVEVRLIPAAVRRQPGLRDAA